MDRLTCMHSFVRTVETGNFSAVARELGTTQPTISKHIAALEEHLGARLLTRSTRHLSLTDEGERYYEHCRHALEAIEEAEASVAEQQQPAGILRLNCSVSFGQLQIVPRLHWFFARFPQINIDMMMNDRYVDLIEEGVDLAIRIGELEDSSYIAKRIGTTRRITVATPTYIERMGEPQSPQDLQQHDCIVYSRSSTVNEWQFSHGNEEMIRVKVTGRFRADSSAAIREATLSDIGISIAPIWLYGNDVESGKLQVLLRDYEPKPSPIHAIYPSRRYQPVKVRSFIDFLATEFRLDPWLSDYGQ